MPRASQDNVAESVDVEVVSSDDVGLKPQELRDFPFKSPQYSLAIPWSPKLLGLHTHPSDLGSLALRKLLAFESGPQCQVNERFRKAGTSELPPCALIAKTPGGSMALHILSQKVFRTFGAVERPVFCFVGIEKGPGKRELSLCGD